MGAYQGTRDLGTGPIVKMPTTSTFVTKFDAAGNTKWSKAFGGAGDVGGSAARVDPAGHILLTGGFFNTVDFGSGPVTGKGLNDLFVTKLDGAGQLIWNKTAGDGDIQAGGTVAVDHAGHVFVGARILGAVDMGTGAVSSHGKDDALVAKLEP